MWSAVDDTTQTTAATPNEAECQTVPSDVSRQSDSVIARLQTLEESVQTTTIAFADVYGQTDTVQMKEQTLQTHLYDVIDNETEMEQVRLQGAVIAL